MVFFALRIIFKIFNKCLFVWMVIPIYFRLSQCLFKIVQLHFSSPPKTWISSDMICQNQKTKTKASWKLNFFHGRARNTKQITAMRTADHLVYCLGLWSNTDIEVRKENQKEWHRIRVNESKIMPRTCKCSRGHSNENISIVVNLRVWRVKIWQWINECIFIHIYIYIRHIECRKESSDDDDNDKNQKSSSLSWMGPRARLCPFFLFLFLCVWCMMYVLNVFCARRNEMCALVVAYFVHWLVVCWNCFLLFLFLFLQQFAVETQIPVVPFSTKQWMWFYEHIERCTHSLSQSLNPLPYLEMNFFSLSSRNVYNIQCTCTSISRVTTFRNFVANVGLFPFRCQQAHRVNKLIYYIIFVLRVFSTKRGKNHNFQVCHCRQPCIVYCQQQSTRYSKPQIHKQQRMMK